MNDDLKQAVEHAIATGNAEEIELADGHKIILFCRGNLEEAKQALREDIVRRYREQRRRSPQRTLRHV